MLVDLLIFHRNGAKIYPKIAEIRGSQQISIELHRTHPISKPIADSGGVLKKRLQISADVSGN